MGNRFSAFRRVGVSLLLGTLPLLAQPLPGTLPTEAFLQPASEFLGGSAMVGSLTADRVADGAREAVAVWGLPTPEWFHATSRIALDSRVNLADSPARPAADDQFGGPLGFVLFLGAIWLLYHSEWYRIWFRRTFGPLDQY